MLKPIGQSNTLATLWDESIHWERKKKKKTDAGKYWELKEKGVAEDKMVRLYHQLNGHEFK